MRSTSGVLSAQLSNGDGLVSDVSFTLHVAARVVAHTGAIHTGVGVHAHYVVRRPSLEHTHAPIHCTVTLARRGVSSARRTQVTPLRALVRRLRKQADALREQLQLSPGYSHSGHHHLHGTVTTCPGLGLADSQLAPAALDTTRSALMQLGNALFDLEVRFQQAVTDVHSARVVTETAQGLEYALNSTIVEAQQQRGTVQALTNRVRCASHPRVCAVFGMRPLRCPV